MKIFRIIPICILLMLCTIVSAQVIDSSEVEIPVDSLTMVMDSMELDTLGSDSMKLDLGYKISKDGIDQVINYGSNDSLIMDNIRRLVHLYGDAYVKYGALDLKANYILLDLNTNIALAEGTLDSAGNLVGKPIFKDGTQEFDAGRMRYNFKTRKGLVYDVKTEQGDLYVLGATTKFYGEGGEAKRENHTIYSSDAIFTTCDHDVPHFGIRSRKQKVIPNKVAIVGPSNLEIGGVPTPLYLPFGFFPLKTGKRGGLMFPNNYQYSDRWGFGLENVGYFFPISDNFDLTVLTDFYFRGSYGVDTDLRYKKRYKYEGSLKLGYSSYKTEETQLIEPNVSELVNVRQNSYFIKLSHSQNPSAHPYRTLSGSINMEVNRFDNLNYNDANRVLNNTRNSNFSLTQKIAGTPFTASLGLSHSQNIATRQMRMSLPRFDLRMKQINPFKKKRRVGPEQWFEKVTLTYNSSLRYDLNGVDTTFFEAETFQDGKFGVQHNISTNVNFNVLKHFQLSPFINVKETWYTKETNKFFFPELTIKEDTIFDQFGQIFRINMDTTSYGVDSVDRNAGFNAIHQYDAGLSLFTKFYSTLQFKKGWLRGLRHTIKPTISMSYSPDYTTESLGYFQDYETRNTKGVLDTNTYSIFESENFGSPPNGGERLSLNYSLINLLEAKLFSKKDSAFNKAKILDNFNISGNYNFIADSLNWSQVRFSGNFRFFKGLAIVKFGGAYDPYAINENGRRINTFEKDVSGKILRFDNAFVGLNAGLTVKQLRGLFSSSSKSSTDDKKKSAKDNLGNLFDKLRMTYVFNLATNRRNDNSLRFEPTVHSIMIRGDIPLSPKWRLTVGNIDYNFIKKSVSYPDLSLSRDLHCWTMGVSWQPERATYNFYLRVKPGSLDFIRMPYRRNRADGFDN